MIISSVIFYELDGSINYELKKEFKSTVDAENYARKILGESSNLYKAIVKDILGADQVFYKDNYGGILVAMLGDLPDFTYEDAKTLEYDWREDKFYWGKEGLEFRKKLEKERKRVGKMPEKQREKFFINDMLEGQRKNLKHYEELVKEIESDIKLVKDSGIKRAMRYSIESNRKLINLTKKQIEELESELEKRG